MGNRKNTNLHLNKFKMNRIFTNFFFVLCISLFCTLTTQAQSSCCNTSQYPFGSTIAPNSGNTTTISTCNYLSEYSEISSVIAGSSYTLEVGNASAWITVYSGSSCGTYIADGSSPLTFTAPTSGTCLLYTSPSPRDRQKSRMPSSA